jgi:DNA repair protein RecN (Recombination protein N)
MLRRLYLKNLIFFDEVELEFVDGLIVFSGPSGAGKSLLMHSILANFGIKNSEARICEIELDKPKDLNLEEFELDSILTLKSIRRERVRFYLNNQNISKKRLKEMFKPYIHYLSVQDERGFKSQKLLKIIDLFITQRDNSYLKKLENYKKRFEIYSKKRQKLKKIEEDEKRILELIEFTKFEIEKIESINPQVKEYEELLRIKHRLSKIDKIQEALKRASAIFELEDDVNEIFNLSEKDGNYFNETMNQLRVDFEEIEELTLELSDINIEEVLERLEKISALINRYGSIQEALKYKEKKQKELEKLENLNNNKEELKEFIKFESKKLLELAKEISFERKKEALNVAKKLNSYLKKLKLPETNFVFKNKEIYEEGIDEVDLKLEKSSILTLSGGEFNRLRLALMSLEAKLQTKQNGIIFLDEIDANVSGDESIAIAQMVEELSKKFQVFAVSHQPHLSSKAKMQVLVSKQDGISKVKILNSKERVKEIARMIGGEENKEAVAFAEKLFAKIGG